MLSIELVSANSNSDPTRESRVPRSAKSQLTRSGIRYGAAYYAEYQLSDRVEADLDLMLAAGFTVIRVGESVWSTWEPTDGHFEFEWLRPVLDGARARGIDVILGTPTYAIPPWLQKAHPEIAAHRKTGVVVPWGARQEANFAHPEFRRYAERVIRQILDEFASHSAIIGFQVDNEPGIELLHNPDVFAGFVESLKEQYGSVDVINREWGLTYWSHRLSDFDELWTPDGNTIPQYDLAWRRYQARLTTDFISWQTSLVREYSSAAQFVTTCIAYPRPALHDAELSAPLDITAGNPYYGMQDHLALDRDLTPIQPWTTTGVWGLLRQADRMYSSSQARFLITETNAQTIAGSDQNYPPYPGQLRQAAFAFVARGASMVEYWHWHSLHFGTETYWGGVLPHSQVPGRIYREAAEIGREIKKIGAALDTLTPDADVAILWSTESKWALEFMPPMHSADGTPDRAAYSEIFDAYYRGCVAAGAQVRILHPEQAEAVGAATLVERFPTLIVPAMYIATDAQLDLLREYAIAGGHLVLGIRTGYADPEARARAEVAPARLNDVAGVWYEEFSNLPDPLPVTGDSGFVTSVDAMAICWADGLIPTGADVLLRYDHPELGRFAAATTATAGVGRITWIGTVPNPALAEDLMRWAAPSRRADAWMRGPGVTVLSGSLADEGRAWFVHNWSSVASTCTIPVACRDLVSGASYAAGSQLSLDPWSAMTMVEG